MLCVVSLTSLITERLHCVDVLLGHMFTNVYPDWMKTQLETNDSTVMVENENGQLVEVAINQKNLPDYQHKQIMSHLRTAHLWDMSCWLILITT